MIGETVSSVDSSVSGNNDTNRLVDCCPCLVWSKCPSAVGVVCGGFADNMSLVSRGKDGINLHRIALANDDKAGLPNAACINRTNDSSVLLLDGIEWYCAADARA